MKSYLHYTAKEMVDMLYRKEVSPIELLDEMTQRITKDQHVNAVVQLEYQRAIDLAKRYNPPKGAQKHNHLYGLPLLSKALVSVEGFKHTSCSPIHKERVATSTDWHAKHLESHSGGIILGLTNSPEYGAGGNTFNALYGRTKNPWNLSLNSGGSSGGSAAALASGQCWLADGSDYAGSIRLPAGYCGVVGLRPSQGVVPAAFPSSIPAVIGPMARNVTDTALFLDALCYYEPKDPSSIPLKKTNHQKAILRAKPPKKNIHQP